MRVSWQLADEMETVLGKYGTVVGRQNNRISVLIDGMEYVVEINVSMFNRALSHEPYGELWLLEVGEKKIQVIKEIRQITLCSLTDAKNLVDRCAGRESTPTQRGFVGTPQKVCEGIIKEDFTRYRLMLESAGAKVREQNFDPLDPFARRLVETSLQNLEKELTDDRHP